MRWRAYVATAAVAGSLAGCMHEPAYVGDGFKPLNPNEGTPGSVRSQKPDAEPGSRKGDSPLEDRGTVPFSGPAKHKPPKSLLDMPPERPGDPHVVQVVASIRAVVNGKAILDEEVREACFWELKKSQVETVSAEERTAKQKDILTKALDLLVERELLVEDAHKRLDKNPQGKKFLEKMSEHANKEFDRWLKNVKSNPGLNLKSDDELKAWLRAQGLSLEGMRKQKENQLIAEEYLRQMVWPIVDRVGHLQIVEYYLGHPEEFQVTESIKWQDLLIDASQYPSRKEARQIAEQVVHRLRNKEDFAKLAQLHDPRGFQFTQGNGEGQKRGEIRPREVEGPLYGLRDGDAAVVEMPNGFHVVRLVKHTFPGRMPLDDKLQSQIRDKLRNEVGIREQKRFLAQLKSKATIEYSNITQ
jgi:hypothetical protein